MIDFLAAGTTPEGLVNFRPSESVQARVADLIDRDREGALSPAETQELADFLQLEHLMIMAKAQAHRNLLWHLAPRIPEQLRRFIADRGGYRCELRRQNRALRSRQNRGNRGHFKPCA